MNKTIAVVGNPNVGKTEVFNALTGLSQTTGNYPGVTVARKHGRMSLNGYSVEIVDLPGTYTLAARSPDEVIVSDVLLGQQSGESRIDSILLVVDAANMTRNLYLLSQIQELRLPLVVALNMMDVAESHGLTIHVDKFSDMVKAPIVPICAQKRKGIEKLKESLLENLENPCDTQYPGAKFSKELDAGVTALEADLAEKEDVLGHIPSRIEAFRILVDKGGFAERRIMRRLGSGFADVIESHRDKAQLNGSLVTEEAQCRYAWAKKIVASCVQTGTGSKARFTEVADSFLTHRIFGSIFLCVVMLGVFQSIYTWATPLMDGIDAVFGTLGNAVSSLFPGQGVLQSLLVDGMIAGVGSVIIFLPQIMIISFFIALLEDCGYMARAAFLMDKLFSWCGLSGQSFLPMLSSFACAIPGIMATRTIENRRDRIVTILVAPLMSCSARLPVYIIMISAFIPDRPIIGGVLNLQAATLFGLYVVGLAVALPTAWLLKKTLLKGDRPPFVLEIPSYKMPRLRTVLQKVYFQGREFLYRAGTTIFTITVIVWALAYFPHSSSITGQFDGQRAALTETMTAGDNLDEALGQLSREESRAYLEASFLGRFGHAIEPAVRPLGWDWRLGTAVIASFPAREIIVATLGTIFNLGEGEDAESLGLRDALRNATWPDGRPLFNVPVALSVMVFFALCMQCGATLVMMKRETGLWRWPFFTFTYMTVLAYVAAFVTYQGTMWLGWGGI